MKMSIPASIAALLLLSLSHTAHAGDFDGSKPVLCSVIKVIEFTPEDGCREVTPKSVAVPQFLTIDFEKKIVRPAGKVEGDRSSAIKRMERIGGKLILQGADEGIQNMRDSVGWTATVTEETGKFVVTAAGDQEAFIVYGACLPLP
jgi:hypothetical protein